MVRVINESINDRDVMAFYKKLEKMHDFIGKQMNQIKKSDFPDVTMKATVDKIEDFYGDLQGIIVNYKNK